MAVRIRLRRIGKRKQPQYRVVVAEAKGPRDGRFIESIGHYNPRVDPPAMTINEERALWWLEQGARPSETAKAMMVKTGLWEKFTGEPAPAVAEKPAAPAVAAEPEPPAVAEEPAPPASAGEPEPPAVEETVSEGVGGVEEAQEAAEEEQQ